MNLYQNTSFNKNVSEPKALQSKYQDLLMSQIQPWNSNFFYYGKPLLTLMGSNQLTI